MSSSLRLDVKIASHARRDAANISRWTVRRFGPAAARRYEALIAQAIYDLTLDPAKAGSIALDDMDLGWRTYHLSFSRNNVSEARVKDPRHLILYRLRSPFLEVGRILHDCPDLTRHLPGDRPAPSADPP